MARSDLSSFHLYPEQIEALKEYTTQTRLIYAEAFRMRNKVALEDRPENQDIEIPMSVQLLRIAEMASQKNDEIKATLKRIEESQTGFFRSIGNIFSFGKGEMERHKPKK